jgi:hypothetical protein
MPAPVLSGPQYLREGLKLVFSPSLRLFVLLATFDQSGAVRRIDLSGRPPIQPVGRYADAVTARLAEFPQLHPMATVRGAGGC